MDQQLENYRYIRIKNQIGTNQEIKATNGISNRFQFCHLFQGYEIVISYDF